MHRRTPLRMGPLRFRDPVLLCGVLYGLLLFDASGFLRTGLLAAFLHEWGHILVYCAPVSYTHLTLPTNSRV